MPYNIGDHAIYQSPRRVYFVPCGFQIPRNSKRVLDHPDRTSLAWAFDKSTFGRRDGSREPGCDGDYPTYAREVLERVLKSKAVTP